MYKDKLKLEEHKNIAHENQPPKGKKCTECELVFTQHQMIIHRNRVHFPKRHYCEPCDKSYGSNYMLKKHHQLVHSGEKNFHCEECGRNFKRSQVLLDHKRTHSGEKP